MQITVRIVQTPTLRPVRVSTHAFVSLNVKLLKKNVIYIYILRFFLTTLHLYIYIYIYNGMIF